QSYRRGASGPIRCMFRAARRLREKPEFQRGKGVRWAPRRATWHTLRRTRVAGGTLLPLASGRVTGRRGGGLRRHREDDGEGGAPADRALDGDVAAHQAREAARERESQADAVAPPVRRAELAEHVEHGLVVLGRDAGARVAHPDGDAAVRQRRGGETDTPLAGELRGVREEVLDDDAQLRALGRERREAGGDVGLEGDRLVAHEEREPLGELAQ